MAAGFRNKIDFPAQRRRCFRARARVLAPLTFKLGQGRVSTEWVPKCEMTWCNKNTSSPELPGPRQERRGSESRFDRTAKAAPLHKKGKPQPAIPAAVNILARKSSGPRAFPINLGKPTTKMVCSETWFRAFSQSTMQASVHSTSASVCRLHSAGLFFQPVMSASFFPWPSF